MEACWALSRDRIERRVFRRTQIYGWVLSHYLRMKKKDLTPKQACSVPCPTCGVAAGRRCVLHSGTLRFQPHVDRKLSAIEAIEKKLR
jgi:hypothetical protein